mgnify:CR=1 FL=1
MSLFGPDYKDELRIVNLKLDLLIMKVSELVETLGAVRVQLKKASTEILVKIDALSSSDPDLSPEVLEALADIKLSAQALDDIVPDAVPEV